MVMIYLQQEAKLMFNSQPEQLEDFKKKRENFSENIRRANRDEVFSKRRNFNNQSINNQQEGGKSLKTLVIDDKLKPQILQMINAQYYDSMLPQLLKLARSFDILEKHRGIIGIRKIISTQVQAPLQQVIDAGLVNQCFNLIKQYDFPQLRLEGAWILTNIASGTAEQTQILIDKGCIEMMVQLLNQNQPGIVDQAIWALGNIAADSAKYRDKILVLGGLEPLIKIVQSTQNKNLLKNGVWTATNLVRGYPYPKYQLIKPALPLIAKVVKSGLIKDKEVLADCVWALSYLSQGAKSRVQRLIETGIIPLIFQLVKDQYTGISIPSLRIIGNLSTGNQLQTQQLLNNNFFKVAYELLEHPKRAMRRQTCWILSNIAAGTNIQVNAFLQETALLQKLLNKLAVDLMEVRRQILWIFANFGHLGTTKKILQLYVECDIIRYFQNILSEEEQKTLENGLTCLEKVLNVGDKARVDNQNMILKRVYTSSIVNELERLQEHKSRTVYKCAVKIINKYFQVENVLI